MRRLLAWLRTLDRNDLTYWLGLLILFIGLTGLRSAFVALTVVGAVMAIESVITSYMAQWIKARNLR